MKLKIIGLSLLSLVIVGCDDQPKTCGGPVELEKETLIYEDPDSPIQIEYEVEVDNVYFEGTYEIGPQFQGGTVDFVSSSVVNILKASFEYDNKTALISITYDKDYSAIEKISFEPNINEDFEIFSCVGAECLGAVLDEGNSKVTLTDVLLTKEGSVETETISGVFTYAPIALEDVVVEYESCQ
jgi:hypothetical protein